MICPNCGRTVPDGTQCPCMGSTPLLSSNPAVNVIKTVGSSTQFLVLAILYSVSVLFSVVTAITADSTLENLIYSAYDYGIDPSLLYPFANQNALSAVLGAIFSSVPGILIATALWLHFSSSRGTATGGVSTAGMTIWKVMAIISLVGCCLGILAALFFVILFIAVLANMGSSNAGSYHFYSYGYGDPEVLLAGASVLLGILAVVVIMALVLYLIYDICVLKTVNRMKNVVHTGMPDNRIPRYLIVMNYVFGIIAGIGGLFSLFSSPIAGVGSLVGAAGMILTARLLSECRNRMTMLLYPPVQPVYAQPPQNAYQPYGYGQAPVQQFYPSSPENASSVPPQQPAYQQPLQPPSVLSEPENTPLVPGVPEAPTGAESSAAEQEESPENKPEE